MRPCLKYEGLGILLKMVKLTRLPLSTNLLVSTTNPQNVTPVGRYGGLSLMNTNYLQLS